MLRARTPGKKKPAQWRDCLGAKQRCFRNRWAWRQRRRLAGRSCYEPTAVITANVVGLWFPSIIFVVGQVLLK